MIRILIFLSLIPFMAWANLQSDLSFSEEINQLALSLSSEGDDHYKGNSTLKAVVDGGKHLLLNDGSTWLIGSTYRTTVQEWQSGDRLALMYHHEYSNCISLKNLDKKATVWGVNEQKPKADLSPYILRLSNSLFESKGGMTLTLNNGDIFKGPKMAWKLREAIFVLPDARGSCGLWNLSRGEISANWEYTGNENEESCGSLFNIDRILGKKVLGQPEAINQVATCLFNAWAGLNDPQAPLGVFLFLGPTGVGKTELAKALCQVLYKNQSHLIRFDMSQFPTPHDYTRLIGSPPGYVNHEEGGQLTEALRRCPNAIVLLDEIEKAHPMIRKAFLPIFDEGYVVDSKNRKIDCHQAIFIMTSNLFSEEMTRWHKEGCDTVEILKIIEPQLLTQVSPELYNRVTPLVFNPITPDLMAALVDQKLQGVIERLSSQKEMRLVVDDGVRRYLAIHGFHPSLGVRPLKRLIQDKVVALVAYTIIKEGIPEGSSIFLSYSVQDDAWQINWCAI